MSGVLSLFLPVPFVQNSKQRSATFGTVASMVKSFDANAKRAKSQEQHYSLFAVCRSQKKDGRTARSFSYPGIVHSTSISRARMPRVAVWSD